jgi:predicted ATPase
MGAHCYLAWELWQLGYPDQALQHSRAARVLAQESSQLPFGSEVTDKQHSRAVRVLAQEVSHHYNLAYALLHAAVLHQFRREAQAAHELSEAAMTLSTGQGFALWLAWNMVLHGWALAMQGQVEAGIAQIRQGLAATEAVEFKAYKPHILGLLAEAYRVEGRPEEGLHTLAEALVIMDTTAMRFYEAELHRLKGELVLQQSSNNAPAAEACFHQALDIARQQQAKSWELRAAVSLARLWQQQGKPEDARALLTDVYSWFTEGFDTADLQEARALLETLA